MELKLARILFVFFERSEFVDFNALEKQIRSSIYDFDRATKINYGECPPNLQQMQNIPVFQLSHNVRHITVSKNTLEYSISGVFDIEKYNDVIGTFCAEVKLLSRICASRDNICTRLGIVNNSFLVTKNAIAADTILYESFLNEKKFKKVHNVSLSYVKELTNHPQKIIAINSLSVGKLNTSPPQDGIIITKDINIPQKQVRISEIEVSEFIDFSIEHIGSKQMIEGITNA